MKITFTLRGEDAALTEEEVREIIASGFVYDGNPRIVIESTAAPRPGSKYGGRSGMVLAVEPTVEVTS